MTPSPLLPPLPLSPGTRKPARAASKDGQKEANQALIPFMLPKDGQQAWPYCLFISMELCDGPTLQEWMARRPQVPLAQHGQQEISLFKQILLGVYHVHSLGIIHRCGVSSSSGRQREISCPTQTLPAFLLPGT